jgi:hypothetical protein
MKILIISIIISFATVLPICSSNKKTIIKLFNNQSIDFFVEGDVIVEDGLIGEIRRTYRGRITDTEKLKKFILSYRPANDNEFDGGSHLVKKSLIEKCDIDEKK